MANCGLRTNSRSYSAPKVKLESKVISRVGSTVPLGAIRLAPGDKVWLGVTIPPITSPTSFFSCARAGGDHRAAVMGFRGEVSKIAGKIFAGRFEAVEKAR